MSEIVLTDPQTADPDDRCPRCRGDERVPLGLDGVREACPRCGYEFPLGAPRA